MNDSAPSDPPDPQPLTPAPTPHGACANCGAELHGPHCHQCGQPVKGMIRPLSGLTADVVDTVFNIDSRVLRTLGPLYFKPGFLTTEYFIGRRVRYVTPFRLFFFLTIIAFLVTSIYSDQMGLSETIGSGARMGGEAVALIQKATTTDDVSAQRDVAMAGLDAALKNAALPAEARREIEAAREEIRKAAQQRIDALKAIEDAKAKGIVPPIPPLPSEAGKIAVPQPPAAPDPDTDIPPIVFTDDDKKPLSFNGKEWDPKKDPVKISWLPDAVNAKLTDMVVTAIANAKDIPKNPKRIIAAFFGVLPQTLFVLMPLFAVMLKIFFIFKRRYYMEHLIVAIHSHAFLSLSMLVISLLGLARLAIPAAAMPLGWLMIAATAWMPIYLLLMQKRVYRQNWFMTLLKYSVIGYCYSVLIGLAIAAAMVISLVVA
ncbi:MAG TPA: DUF3667 domain-containing protein [Tahibacter sp.]|uniref:DUF3667 domain-containing protein n=1 Tax=Tahibacter sp. TaxID=2056211 RepID=UPI002C3F1395|nr:DUF3667 domain-containing protein [Tahibacter sp.]HSX58905.1 DUF3667 domain-containing protein [Tahibacter sp.]